MGRILFSKNWSWAGEGSAAQAGRGLKRRRLKRRARRRWRRHRLAGNASVRGGSPKAGRAVLCPPHDGRATLIPRPKPDGGQRTARPTTGDIHLTRVDRLIFRPSLL